MSSKVSLKKLFLFFAIVVANQNSIARASNEDCQATLAFRNTPTHSIFTLQEQKHSLDDRLYWQTREQLNSSKEDVIDYLQRHSRVRDLEIEEMLAALDSLVPYGRSLFEIFKTLKNFRINERDFNAFLSPLVSTDSLATPSPIDSAILEIAAKLHFLSMNLLANQNIISPPEYHVQDIAAIDRYLSNIVRSLNPTTQTLKTVFAKNPWSELPVLREVLYSLGFIWVHPLMRYRPSIKSLNLAGTDPATYTRRLYWRFGPQTTLYWIQTHLRWAALVAFAFVLPGQLSAARESIQSGRVMYSALIEMNDSPEERVNFQNTYRGFLIESYKGQVTEMKTELEQLEDKLRNSFGDSNTKKQLINEIEVLKERIRFFEAKINH